MTSSKDKGEASRPAKGGKSPAGTPAEGKSDWTKGLRQLYDSVVDEPLPDNFKNLLDQLDKK